MPGLTLALINEIDFGAYNTDGAGYVYTKNISASENVATTMVNQTITFGAAPTVSVGDTGTVSAIGGARQTTR